MRTKHGDGRVFARTGEAGVESALQDSARLRYSRANTLSRIRVATASVVLASLLGGCTTEVSPRHAEAPPSGSTCAASPVGAQGFSVAPTADGAPGVWLPAVSNWERDTQFDQPHVELMLRNRGLGAHNLAQSAYVVVMDITDPAMTTQQMLDDYVKGTKDRYAETGRDVTTGFEPQHADVCGLDARHVAYTVTVEQGLLSVATTAAAVPTGTRTFLATLTVQSLLPEDPQFKKDVKTFLGKWTVFTTGTTPATHN